MPTSSGQWKRDLIDMENRLQYLQSTSDLKRAPNFPTSNRTLEIPYLYNWFLNQHSQPTTRLSIDRAVDRPLPPVDWSIDRAPNRELSTFSRSTGQSTELLPCARCARQSTGPVDRSPATAGGRPGRSTDLLILLLLTCFATVPSFLFHRRLSWRSLDDTCRLPWQLSLSFQHKLSRLIVKALIHWHSSIYVNILKYATFIFKYIIS